MKILVSDFDYTFFSLDYSENIKRVQEFVSKDNMFIIATSRNLRQLMEDVKDLYVPYFFAICNDGAMIYDRKGKILFKKSIDPSIVPSIFHHLDKQKCIGEILLDNGEEYSMDLGKTTYNMIAKPKDYDKAKKVLDKIRDTYPINGYLNDYWIDIIDQNVSKGKGIDFLLETFHLDKNDVYVIGDNENDLSMFEKYKGYTMEDAPPLLKEKSIKVVQNLKELIDIIENDEA